MVTRTKKIFVGGLSAPTTLEDVKSYFEQFGTVSEVFRFIFYRQFYHPVKVQSFTITHNSGKSLIWYSKSGIKFSADRDYQASGNNNILCMFSGRRRSFDEELGCDSCKHAV